MLIAERFIGGLVKNHGNHPVSTDGGTWYPQACRFLGLEHHLHSSFEKSIIERTMQYIKDRTENFDDYFPCRIKNCKLKHVRNWLRFFVDYHNKEIKPVKWTEPSAGKRGNDSHIHILRYSSTNNILLFYSIIAAIGENGSVNSILTSINLYIILLIAVWIKIFT